MSLTSDVMTLANAPLFREMSEEQLRLIAFGARKREFREGDVVFREGRPAEGASIVAEGRLAVENEAGERGMAGTHALLDELALIGRRPHRFTATAEARGALMIIDRTLFRRMVDEFPDIAERVRVRIERRVELLTREAEGPLRRLAGEGGSSA